MTEKLPPYPEKFLPRLAEMLAASAVRAVTPALADRVVRTLADTRGRQVTIGVSGGKVTLRTSAGGAVELDGVLCEDFQQAFMSAQELAAARG